MGIMNIISGLRGSVTSKVVDTLGVQTALEVIPNKLSDTIQPVLSVEPEKEVMIASKSNTGTVLTASSKKRTFITGFVANFDDTLGSGITASIKLKSGKTEYLFSLGGNSLGNSQLASRDFSLPIEILKGSPVTLTNSGGEVGLFSISYYEVD